MYYLNTNIWKQTHSWNFDQPLRLLTKGLTIVKLISIFIIYGKIICKYFQKLVLPYFIDKREIIFKISMINSLKNER